MRLPAHSARSGQIAQEVRVPVNPRHGVAYRRALSVFIAKTEHKKFNHGVMHERYPREIPAKAVSVLVVILIIIGLCSAIMVKVAAGFPDNVINHVGAEAANEQ